MQRPHDQKARIRTEFGQRRSGKSMMLRYALTMGMMLAPARFQGATPTHVIVDETATLPRSPQLPLSPAEQDGEGLRPNRKDRRRAASRNR